MKKKLSYRRPILVYQPVCWSVGSGGDGDRLRIIMPDGGVYWMCSDPTLWFGTGWDHKLNGDEACTSGKNAREALKNVKEYVATQSRHRDPEEAELIILGNL